MSRKKKIIFYVSFFVLLFAAFYLFAFKNYDFSAAPLKVINAAVPAFSFTDQDGRTITQADTDDKVYVAEYFFTTCRGICPKLNASMRRVFDAYSDEKDFLILSHTCMPETDDVKRLKAYEQMMINGKLIKAGDGSYTVTNTAFTQGAPNPNWHFLTGDKTKLYEMARAGYIIDNGNPDSTQNISEQFIHTQFFALVDRYRRVRGIYDGLKNEEVEKLMKDIKSLLKEKADHTRFITGFSNSPT